jgi:GT2 family glycosyltransferase
MSRSLVIVNFHSAELTRQAIESARLSSDAPLQVVVVDNSLDRDEQRRLSLAGADRVIISPANSGYAGGINQALPHCTGDSIVICNPDVRFAPAAIDRLTAALEGEVAISGPKFVWDEAGDWYLPPAEMAGRWSKESELLALRSRRWRALRSRRRLRRRIAFWRLSAPAAVTALSGAVMALRSELFDQVGRFDERFPLYFEEIDFMRRARQAGRSLLYEPRAVCRHLYNQSGALNPESGNLYLQSELAYHEKWSGRSFSRRLERAGRSRPKSVELPLVSGRVVIPDGVAPETVLIELSPLADFTTAAGHFPRAREVDIPAEVIGGFGGETLYVRMVSLETLKTLSAGRLVVSR